MGMRATLVGEVELCAEFAAAAVEFNRSAIRNAGSEWIPFEHFRFATDSADPSVALTILFGTVYKIHDQDKVFSELERVLRGLYFHTGVFVDRSIDRTLVGGPDAYILDFENESFSNTEIAPAGDGLELELRAIRFDES